MGRFALSSTIVFFPFGLGIIIKDATTFGSMQLDDAI
jgi:hypothetical protein